MDNNSILTELFVFASDIAKATLFPFSSAVLDTESWFILFYLLKSINFKANNVSYLIYG